MSLQGLISGAECALPNNPLSQVLKHTESDTSLQRDRVVGPSSSTLYRLPSASSALANERDLALAHQFFDTNRQNASQALFANPMGFHLSSPELQSMMQDKMFASSPDLQEAWIRMGLQNQARLHFGQERGSEWTVEFAKSIAQGQNFAASSSAPQSNEQYSNMHQTYPQNSFMPSQPYYQPSMPVGMYDTAGLGPQFNSAQDISVGKGKGRLREEDFEAAFAEVAASMSTNSMAETAQIVEVPDNATDMLEAAMHNVSVDDTERLDSSVKYGTDFQTVWDHLQNSSLPPPQEDVARWEAEFNQLMSAQRNDLDSENWLSDYDETWNGSGLTNRLRFDDEGIPSLDEYIFDTSNKYLSETPSSSSSSSLLDRAKSLLGSNGSLTEAALMIEAAIQQGDCGKGGYEAWILLGETRSMDEREEAAMRALKEGVRIAQENGAAGEGMLSLAISYTNESYSKAAHALLLKWLNARFPSSMNPASTTSLQNNPWDSYNHVRDAFLLVARQQHAEGIVDPDVQVGLGVLFYANGEFDKAKDCFESALSVKPRDYLLWNRYGSCLSNGNKPEEALGAYREALNIWPNYTRAIYNVGVACLNIGLYKEASEHFLSALSLQDTTTEGEKSEQLWFTLRRTLTAMGRDDLADKAKMGASVNMFREEGFEF